MPYSPGDTLLIKDPRPWDDRRHLYIVLTAPDAEGLMLLPCVESVRDYTKDMSCVLMPGDHPFITRESVVNYRDSVVIGEAGLDAAVAAGHASRRPALGRDVLERVIEGARRSARLDPRQRAMLPREEQASPKESDDQSPM